MMRGEEFRIICIISMWEEVGPGLPPGAAGQLGEPSHIQDVTCSPGIFLFVCLFWFCFLFFETGFLCIVPAVLELTL